jgi:alkylation response protein AidB-like acyl-CoA dehydrogenase
MNFDLSEDQQILKAVVERFVTDRYDLVRRREYQREPRGFSPENWRMLGELGLIGAQFAPEPGGFGDSAIDTLITFESLGQGLVVEPLIECALLAGGLFGQGAEPALREAWLPDLVSGRKTLTFAHREPGSRNNLGWVQTRAQSKNGRVVLDGEKIAVANPVGADALIVSASQSADPADREAISLYWVPADTRGLLVRPYRQMDGGLAARVAFDNVELGPRNLLRGGYRAIYRAETRASLGRSAEALGIMQMLLDQTLEYVRQRHQFGVPLATFQALQHRLVAQYVALEQSRALLYGAALADASQHEEWRTQICGARAFIAEHSVLLGQDAIQMHGGMGVSDELVVGHAHKRLLMLSRTPSDAQTALDVFAGIAD